MRLFNDPLGPLQSFLSSGWNQGIQSGDFSEVVIAPHAPLRPILKFTIDRDFNAAVELYRSCNGGRIQVL